MSDFTQTLTAADSAPEESGAFDESQPRGFVSANARELQFSPVEMKRFVEMYAANPLFSDTSELLIHDNPYRRPIDQKSIAQFDFSRPLTRANSFGASALAAHRMLLNIYETDLVFLPENNFASKRNDFTNFYSNDSKVFGELVRPMLETHVFGFLADEINVTGRWSVDAVQSYLQALVKQHEQSELEICAAVRAAEDPVLAARWLMIQVAGDFLSEASASARNILGKYGALQSELFKIVIDDYGYGVHQAKHSTLFENTLATCGLSSDAHAYWQFYLGSSLALNNYYHYVSRDHSKYFRAIGAIAVAESLFAHSCRKISEMLRAVFGSSVDTYYFDEHYHIDAHHGRMAFDYVVAPAIEQHGEAIIPDIMRGMEELQLITSLADEDFVAQLAWAGALEDFKTQAQKVRQRILEGQLQPSKTSYVATLNQPSVTRVYDRDKLCVIDSGTLDIIVGYGHVVRLDAGDCFIIPRQRLHGLTAASAECGYHVYDLGDYQVCLS